MGLIAAALASQAIADFYYQFAGIDPVTGRPSPADFFYLAFYLLAILGLRNLALRSKTDPLPGFALLPPLLGLATAWSALVFGPVLADGGQSTAAEMVTFAYPLLDLMVVGGAIIALGVNGWRLGPSMVTLIAGMVMIGAADSVYAVAVEHGSFSEQTAVEFLWPAGSVLIALAPWLQSSDAPAPQRAPGERDRRLELGLTLLAVAVAVTVLVLGHFDRADDASLALATLTILAAAFRLVSLYAESERFRRSALRAERERGRVENLHAASAQAAADAIVTFGGDGVVVEWNPAAERIFGYPRGRAIGRPVWELIVPPERREGHSGLIAAFASGDAALPADRRVEMTGARADGSEFPIEMTIAAVETADGDRSLFTAYIADITQRKQRDAERERLAAMVSSAEDAMFSVSRDLVVIAWNPAAERVFGYPAAEIVGEHLERVVPANRRDELHRICEMVGAGESVSFETSRLRRDGEEIDVACQVYPVRDEFGHVTAFSSVARDITDRRRKEHEARLHREREAWWSQIEEALEHDGLLFHRQPVFDLRRGRITHHELLMRMRLGDELVAPGRFLPFAESSPALMRRLDRWAIGAGIKLAAERPVAVNLSARSLSDPGIAKAVEGALRSHGAAPAHVIFEITETAAAERLEDAHTLVAALRALGCGVALDDFGTGYGSFTYLLRMPITSLKIDTEFIRALGTDPQAERVVSSILAVASNFGLDTVAEGVETPETLERLRAMGADQVQGYLLGIPRDGWAAADDIEAALAAPGADG